LSDSTTALLSERGKTHGDYKVHARITCRLKDVISDECRDRCLRGQQPLTVEQRESLDMIMHKVGRVIAGDASYYDHWDDIAGYAKLCSKKPALPVSGRSLANHPDNNPSPTTVVGSPVSGVVGVAWAEPEIMESAPE
jgi:hypothetical protein